MKQDPKDHDMRTLIMTGKIGPKFESNSIAITDGVRQVAGVYASLDDPATEFKFITEHAADDSVARYFDNGVQGCETRRDPRSSNRDVFLTLATVITDSDR